jgi:hypothetical protein
MHHGYIANVMEHLSDESKISIIMAVGSFRLQYLPSQNMKRKDIQKIRVNQVKMIFINTFSDSGDTNESSKYTLRLFAYMVSHKEYFPKNEVMLYEWTDNMEDAQIKSAALPSHRGVGHACVHQKTRKK